MTYMEITNNYWNKAFLFGKLGRHEAHFKLWIKNSKALSSELQSNIDIQDFPAPPKTQYLHIFYQFHYLSAVYASLDTLLLLFTQFGDSKKI